MHFVQAKSILSAKNGMNLYRGCQHGCIYCDARSLCYQMNHPFEDIEVDFHYKFSCFLKMFCFKKMSCRRLPFRGSASNRCRRGKS